MATGEVHADLPHDPATVWSVIADFGGIDRWLPGVTACRLEGDERVLEMAGMTIRERRLSSDDEARRLVYGITGGAPVDAHRATITAAPAGDGCRVTWAVEVTPDEMLPLMLDVYRQGLEALATHLSG